MLCSRDKPHTANFSCVQISVLRSLPYGIACRYVLHVHLEFAYTKSIRDSVRRNTEIRTQLKFAVDPFPFPYPFSFPSISSKE